MSRRARPVGVMDSGVGGLSVLREIRSLLPHEDLLYVADSGHAPYGDRTRGFVEQRVNTIADFLVDRGAKAIVVACNTATEMAIESVRARHQIPIVGMEPAIKTAAAATKSGIVGVLATTGTLRGHRVAALIEQQGGRNLRFLLEACPDLVQQVERGEIAGPATSELVGRHVRPMLASGADLIVLGCTHFHFLRPVVETVAGPRAAVVDPGAAVARQLEARLVASDLSTPSDGAGSEAFWTTANDDMSRTVARLWGRNVPLRRLAMDFVGGEAGEQGRR